MRTAPQRNACRRDSDRSARSSFINITSITLVLLLHIAAASGDPLFIPEERYAVGELVLIRADATVVVDLSVSDGQNTYRFMGEPSGVVAFTPRKAGTHTVEAVTRDGNIVTDTFEAIGNAPQATGSLAIRDSKGRVIAAREQLRDEYGTVLDPQAATIPAGRRYAVDLSFENAPVNRIAFKDLLLTDRMDLGVDTVPSGVVTIGAERPVRAYAIDPERLDFTSANVTATAIGTELWKCAQWNFTEQACKGTWVKIADLVPGEEYSFELTPADPGYAETGVATVNSRKPVYRPGETAELIMVVLDTRGSLVSGAQVELAITRPDGQSKSLSTATGEIVETETGIYETTYADTAIEGNYTLTVSATGTGVNSNLTSNFLVLSWYPFDILRRTPVTTDPWKGPFESAITLRSYVPGTFSFTEVLPGNLSIHSSPGAAVSKVNGSWELTWADLTDGAQVRYTANTPLVSPDLYALGPSYVTYDGGVFLEARPWYLAVDPSAYYDPIITNQSGWNDGTGTTHAEIDDGIRQPSTPTTSDYIASNANDGLISEFDFANVTQSDITSIRLWVYTATGTNAEYTFSLQQSNVTRCSTFVPVSTASGWQSCTWSGVSGDLSALSIELSAVSKNGGGAPRPAYVYAAYLEVSYDNPPTVSLTTPANNGIAESPTVSFNFTPADDVSTTLPNCTLYTNTTGSWSANTTIYNLPNGTNTNITVGGIADGPYLWNVLCYDNSGRASFAPANFTVRVNAVPPSISYPLFNITPIDQGHHIRFNVSITDSWGVNASLVTLQYPNGTRINYSLTGNGNEFSRVFTDTTQLGTYNITLIWANDTFSQVGQNTSPSLSFQVVASPPAAFDLLTPANATVSSNLQPNLTWEATADETFKNYTILLDKDAAFGSPDYTYYNLNSIANRSRVVDFALDANAIYYWRVIAYDTYGNSRISTSDFQYITDTLGPNVTLNRPINGSYSTSVTVTFNITANDTNDIDNCTLYHNASGTWQAESTNATITKNEPTYITDALTEGPIVWSVTCTDEAGNPTASFNANNRTVIVDLSPPAVTLISPLNNTFENTTNNIVFNVSASDDLADVASCELIVNGEVQQTRTDITDGVAFTFTRFISNGQYNWSVNCTDTNGWEGASVMYNLTVEVIDADPPLITLNYPAPGGHVSASTIAFNFTPEDATGIENCSIFIDGILNRTNETPANFVPNYFTISGISEGLHNWSVTCTDNSTDYNVGISTTRRFTVDLTDPTVTLNRPLNNSFITTASVVFNHTPVDTNLANCTLYMNSSGTWQAVQTNTTPVSGQANLFTRTVSDGIYVWNVLCADLSGRTSFAQSNLTVRIDTSPPNASGNTTHPSSPATYSPGQSYAFNITWTDNFAIGTVLFEHNFTGTLQNQTATGGPVYTFTITDAPAGTYVYRWYANDTAGNRNATVQHTYIIQKASSAVNLLLNGTDGDRNINEDQDVNMTAEMITPGTGYVEIYRNGTRLTSGTSPVSSIRSFTEPGQYNITAIYNQTQNYTAASETHILTVNDTTGPNITLLFPEDNATVGALIITFEYRVNDSTSVDNCSILINGTLNQTDTTIQLNAAQTFTVAFQEQDYAWQVTCYDSSGNLGQSEIRVVHARETEALVVNTTTDKTVYERGDTAAITTNVTDAFNNPVNASVTTDIIIGRTATPWWNTAWALRKPIMINESTGQNRTDVLVEVNITGLAGNVQNCAELRIIHNDSAQKAVTPYSIYSGDNSTWCYVAFRANVSANANNEVSYYAYYNNSAAPDPGYNANTTTELIFHATNASADEGAPATVSNIIGNNDATSASISVSGGGAQAESAHGGGLINRTLGNVILSVYVRYRYEVPEIAASWALRYSVNDGASYTNSFTDVTTALKQTSAWDDVTADYATLDWTQLNRTRLQGRVTKNDGGGTSTMNLYWVSMNVSVRTPPDITATAAGSTEQWVERWTNSTGTDGVWSFSWPTASRAFGNYSAVSEAGATLFTNGSGAMTFEIVPDTTAPDVTLLTPADGQESGTGSFSFTYRPYDINLANCTLYGNFNGSWAANKTNLTPANNATNTFSGIALGIGVYLWNVQCYDTLGNNGFATSNFTLNITGPDLAIIPSDIWFSNGQLIEGETIIVFANVTNEGLTDTNQTFIVQFLYPNGTQINGNRSVEGGLNQSQVATLNVSHTLLAGTNQIVVVIDGNNTVNESDENNNNATNNITVSLYHIYYGNVTPGVQLDDGTNSSFYIFDNQSTKEGHIFVIDSDSSFAFGNLVALTRTESNSPTANDFSDADVLLGTTEYNDSIRRVWGGGTDAPLQTVTIGLSTGDILNVPYVNSTNSSSFITGILWDSADDASANDQYDTSDKEDLVFVTIINQSNVGRHGTYDYEIKIPKALKEYKGTDSTVAFYYEIQ